MISSRGTEALVHLEDDAPSFMFSSIPSTDIKIWPLLRWPMAQLLAQTELNTVPIAKRVSRGEKIRRVVRAGLPNRYAPRRIKSAEYLFIVNGGTFSQTTTGRKNWLVDDHAALLGDRAAVLQELPLGPWTPREHRPILPSTYSYENAVVGIEAKARRYPLREDDKAHIRGIVSEAFELLDIKVSNENIRRIETKLAARYVRARHLKAEFERLIDRVSPRVVFMQTAAYGDRSPVISSLKDRGITVVEHQHGWIGPSHAAYNFGAAMRTPELSKCLPDILLTFGDMWSSQIRFPHQTVSIGKPHLESMVAGAPPVGDRPRELLVVSSVLEPEKMEAFTLALRQELPADWAVVFRPHPSERSTVTERYAGLAGKRGIHFDSRTDVYESLSNTRAVLGYASTVLYEALAFGCQVLVKDSPLAPLYVEDGLFDESIGDDPESLRRAVRALTTTQPKTTTPAGTQSVDSVWRPQAEQNFLDFVESLGLK